MEALSPIGPPLRRTRRPIRLISDDAMLCSLLGLSEEEQEADKPSLLLPDDADEEGEDAMQLEDVDDAELEELSEEGGSRPLAWALRYGAPAAYPGVGSASASSSSSRGAVSPIWATERRQRARSPPPPLRSPVMRSEKAAAFSGMDSRSIGKSALASFIESSRHGGHRDSRRPVHHGHAYYARVHRPDALLAALRPAAAGEGAGGSVGIASGVDAAEEGGDDSFDDYYDEFEEDDGGSDEDLPPLSPPTSPAAVRADAGGSSGGGGGGGGGGAVPSAPPSAASSAAVVVGGSGEGAMQLQFDPAYFNAVYEEVELPLLLPDDSDSKVEAAESKEAPFDAVGVAGASVVAASAPPPSPPPLPAPLPARDEGASDGEDVEAAFGLELDDAVLSALHARGYEQEEVLQALLGMQRASVPGMRDASVVENFLLSCRSASRSSSAAGSGVAGGGFGIGGGGSGMAAAHREELETLMMDYERAFEHAKDAQRRLEEERGHSRSLRSQLDASRAEQQAALASCRDDVDAARARLRAEEQRHAETLRQLDHLCGRSLAGLSLSKLTEVQGQLLSALSAVSVEMSKAMKVERDCVQERLTCCVCEDREVSYTLQPCGHSVLCDRCVHRIDRRCPICRAHVMSPQRIYFR